MFVPYGLGVFGETGSKAVLPHLSEFPDSPIESGCTPLRAATGLLGGDDDKTSTGRFPSCDDIKDDTALTASTLPTCRELPGAEETTAMLFCRWPPDDEGAAVKVSANGEQTVGEVEEDTKSTFCGFSAGDRVFWLTALGHA